MKLSPRIPVAIQLLAAVLCIGASLRYLTANEFMPYHAVLAGNAWSSLSVGLQTIILGMLRILGGGFLGCGIALAALSYPLSKGERWASWASLAVGCAVWIPTLLVTLMLKSAAPTAQPPTAPTVGILVLVLVSFALSLLLKPARSEANRSLNRTLHSMPAFGLAFHASPNTVLLFRSGCFQR
jgi:hypothetical protein